MNDFCYPHNPIGSLNKLADLLDISLDELIDLQNNTDQYYRLVQKKPKSDGSFREIYDVEPRLKKVHSKILDLFFKDLNYPDYLQGGIRKRDYLSDSKQHLNKKIIINEDVSNFFPSICEKVILQTWLKFFHFPKDVAECLTKLVSYKGFLVQGAKTSGYLCNVILWKREKKLYDYFKSNGFVYSRFVDDVTISTKRNIPNQEKTEIIRKVYGMFFSIGAKPNRKKHKIMPKGTVQKVHGINVSTTVATFPKDEQKKIRSAVYECEQKYLKIPDAEYQSLFNSTKGRVHHISRLNPEVAKRLLERLEKVKPT
ncbi:hypothetical protein O1Q79_01873 [Lonepinella sp. MS14434]|uniref:reverse transcriptase family protein n=1 Tax=Lonepinella sp. MS14434 TaxID=3003617 RepID=UPI0036DAA57F